MLTIQTRPYAGEADIHAIVEVQAAARKIQPQLDPLTFENQRDEYNEPAFDIHRDLRLWEAGDTLLMFAEMGIKAGEETLDGGLYYQIRPEAEDEQLHLDALAWGEARLREAAAEHSGLRPVLRVYCLDSQADRLTLWPGLGFPAVRYAFTMRRDLHQPFPEPQFPAGFTLRSVAGVDEVPAWVECFNLSFIDHYNFHPQTVENLAHWHNTADYRAELDLIAVAADGTFAAFCHCGISPSSNAGRDRSEGSIHVLGTRRGYRRRGLGRAMLLAGMDALKQAGMDDVELGVDALNPSGALKLYESAGFRTYRTWVAHAKELER